MSRPLISSQVGTLRALTNYSTGPAQKAAHSADGSADGVPPTGSGLDFCPRHGERPDPI